MEHFTVFYEECLKNFNSANKISIFIRTLRAICVRRLDAMSVVVIRRWYNIYSTRPKTLEVTLNICAPNE